MTAPGELEMANAAATGEGAVSASNGTWRMRRGATVVEGGVTFSVWAPRAERVVVHVATGAAAGEHELERSWQERGVFLATVPGVRPGDRYGFRVNDGDPLPDPMSRAQPDGVHGLSEVVDPATFVWNDGAGAACRSPTS
jgi:maltooligosyltrehalose trehalohydrolase